MLDRDLLRPGRFDRVIRASLPDAKARDSILRSLLARLPLDLSDLEPEFARQGVDAALLYQEVRQEACADGADAAREGGDRAHHSARAEGDDSAGAEGVGGRGTCDEPQPPHELGVRELARSLSRVTVQCSGADLRHLCHLAAYRALQRHGDARVLLPSDFFAVVGQVCNAPPQPPQGASVFGFGGEQDAFAFSPGGAGGRQGPGHILQGNDVSISGGRGDGDGGGGAGGREGGGV